MVATNVEVTTLECSMPQDNVRIFASAVQCLAKVGKDLILEGVIVDDGESYMTVRTLNDSKTAFTVFTFHSSFFESFSLPGCVSENGYRRVSGKFPLKSCLCAFRSIRNMERFKITFVQQGARHFVTFIGLCKGGLVKRHEFSYEDSDIVDASFNPATASHKITAYTSVFRGILTHMHHAEEVLFSVHPDTGLRIRSFHQNGDQRTEFSTLKTDIQLDKNDLDLFDIAEVARNQDIFLTFGLREFKALLHFCESASVPSMALLFNDPGAPFLLTSDITCTKDTSIDQPSNTGRTFVAKLVMATYVSDEHEEQEQEQEIGQTTNPQNPNKEHVQTKNQNGSVHESPTSKTTSETASKPDFNSDDDTQKVYLTKNQDYSQMSVSGSEESQATFHPPIKRKRS
uniref:Cell cycle checkpoint control protein n=1 Tax=Aplanochytrium stocchinoi TaxID=215587 RepID=A0A7S3LS23_9STRA